MHWELVVFFGIIAFMYSSVGFGGASSYLAVLALYGMPIADMKLTALVCNIIVVTGGTTLFIKNRYLDMKKVLPLVLVSVPLTYAGGVLKLSAHTFFTILGFSLLMASILMFITQKPAKNSYNNMVVNGGIGGAIGFLSGLVGIGGGIFLSPILNLSGWDTAKKIAATASFFILVNSISGIAAQLNTPHPSINYLQLGLLASAVFLGGQLGSRVGINKLRQELVRRVTAVLVFVAATEILYKHLFLPLTSH